MKYGENLQARSVPQWAPYNVDYDALKHLIKANTTRDAGQAVAIPGQVDTTLQRFEDRFFNELSNQHDRAGLFVRSKADEITRRLQSSQKTLSRLLDRCADPNGKPLSPKRREKFARYDDRIEKCGEDVRLLQRFVREQRTAFYKILKKYKKWTGSRAVEDRFNYEILINPKSFTRIDFDPLTAQYRHLIGTIRSSTPDISGPTTPRSESRRPDSRSPVAPPSQVYWNEYDNGSEAEDEPYMISINPNAESTFPGAKTIGYVMSRAMAPVGKMKEWLTPVGSPEQRPLLRDGAYFGGSPILDTDVEDEAYASSNEFPSGYVTHYATFPSVTDQRLTRDQEIMLLQVCIGCFGAAFLILLVASILVTTGRHRLRLQVDAGVITGVVASLFFAVLGIACMLYRTDRLSWFHRICVVSTFITVCILNGILLVIVAENTGL
ncbi:hypothetical protein BJ875DRAFT_15688 [Amylocarpus encephaloides]|uniref:SPX domain-containing protein n=1 Tax=Amylocarpus encephaloides TaxID=45428 RepID=A0A9P7YJK6_9HELO|nr:hypothetical protein BJ875DRAFT_15688 [Amylocarpus encephaloides]